VTKEAILLHLVAAAAWFLPDCGGCRKTVKECRAGYPLFRPKTQKEAKPTPRRTNLCRRPLS
jgi:hypothetical protein